MILIGDMIRHASENINIRGQHGLVALGGRPAGMGGRSGSAACSSCSLLGCTPSVPS